MAITSIGYPAANPSSPQPGDFIRADQWAVMESLVGVKCAVVGASDLAVTQTGSVDRGVSIAAGSVFAGGVLSTSDGPVTIAATTASSGVRYDTVVARFVWGTTKATSLTIVTGGSSNAVASSLVRTPGVQFDVPLALIKVTAGQTAVQVINDLRLFKTYEYTSDDARAFDVAPTDHHARFSLADGSIYEYRSGQGWVGVSRPGYVYDATYGWLREMVSVSRVVTIPSTPGPDGTVGGIIRPQFGTAVRGGEKYNWFPGNGDTAAQPSMDVIGNRIVNADATDGVTVTYSGAKPGSARITLLGVYNTVL